MAELPIACPAAVEVRPAADRPSILCQALERGNDQAQVGGYRSRGQVSALMSGTRDARTVHLFCCDEYRECAIWRAAKEAHWAARRGPDALRDPLAERPPVIDPELRAAVGSLARVGSES